MPLLAFLFFGAFQTASDAPRFLHAQMETRTVSGSLDAEFRAQVRAHQEPAWIAWMVPRAQRGGDSCSDRTTAAGQPVLLEGSRHAVVLFRVERREVTRIRAFASDCEIDAGGLPLIWLNGVNLQDSLRLLDTFAHPEENDRWGERLAPGAISAIGAHADSRALDILIAIARQDQRASLRSAAFDSIGRLRDPRAAAFLEQLIAR